MASLLARVTSSENDLFDEEKLSILFEEYGGFYNFFEAQSHQALGNYKVKGHLDDLHQIEKISEGRPSPWIRKEQIVQHKVRNREMFRNYRVPTENENREVNDSQ